MIKKFTARAPPQTARGMTKPVERSAIHQLLGINPPKPCQPSFALGSAEGNLGSYGFARKPLARWRCFLDLRRRHRSHVVERYRDVVQSARGFHAWKS